MTDHALFVCRTLRATLALALPCLAASPTLAHSIYVYAKVEDSAVVGKAYFRGQAPAQDVSIVALDPQGREIGKTSTDAEGRFRMPAKFRCDTKIVATTGDGHGADYTLPADELPDNLPPPDGAASAKAESPTEAAPAASVPSAATAAAEAKQLRVLGREISALREKLDAYQNEIRFRDLVGGIGYILGLSGVAFYLLGMRRKSGG